MILNGLDLVEPEATCVGSGMKHTSNKHTRSFSHDELATSSSSSSDCERESTAPSIRFLSSLPEVSFAWPCVPPYPLPPTAKDAKV